MRHKRRIGRICVLLGRISLSVFYFVLLPVSAHAAEHADTADLAISLLVVSFVLCICILLVSGFTLWQSHRYYLDTVRLSREITSAVTELHQKVVELIYSLKDFFAHESDVSKKGRRGIPSQSSEATGRIGKIVESIGETEAKIKTLEKTLGRLNEQLNIDFAGNDISRKISALNDIEYAVLFKISQDPKFFEKNSFSSFGATPKILDFLLSRQLIVFDKDGKAEVPKDVAIALRHAAPKN